MAGSLPQVGQNAQVNIDGIDIRVSLDKYKVSKADRFGQKISEGDLRYQDFNPYESAESIANGLQGGGIRRMSDVEHTVNLAQPYKEASGINAAGVPVILAPQQISESLPGSTAPPIWGGEFVPSTGANAGTRLLVCIAGTGVYTRNANGLGGWTLALTLPAVPVREAVGVFKGTLLLGYGATRTAQGTTDLATLVSITDTTNPLFVFALAADRAASYIAGGTAITNTNQILSSTGAITGYAGAVQCDSGAGGVITALAPGGGIAILFVGKDTELGQIGASGVYQALIPFDTRWSTNCKPLKWWLGAAGQQERGPVSLVFPRERSLMNYVPSSTSAGEAMNIAPWANPVVRPPNSRGSVTAIQGTARWLYFTVTTASGHSWVWRRDTAPNAVGQNPSHQYLDLGSVVSNALFVSAVTSFTGNPMLFVGSGNNLVSVILPLDGDSELDDPNCRFTNTGTWDLSDIDLGLPDEDKVGFSVRLVTDQSLVPGGQTVDVQFALDGQLFQDIGTADTNPATLAFPVGTRGRKISPRLVFSTSDPTKTPQLWAVVFRLSLNPLLYKLVKFEGVISSGGFFGTGADNMSNPQDSINQLWADATAGLPVLFADRWGDIYTARLIDFSENQATMQPDATPETTVTCTLLLTEGPLPQNSGVTLYDDPQAMYDVPTAVYS